MDEDQGLQCSFSGEVDRGQLVYYLTSTRVFLAAMKVGIDMASESLYLQCRLFLTTGSRFLHFPFFLVPHKHIEIYLPLILPSPTLLSTT